MKKCLVAGLMLLLVLAFAQTASAKTVSPMPAPIEMGALENASCYAYVDGYDENTNELTVRLCYVEKFAADDIEALSVGDILIVDGKETEIKTIKNDLGLVLNCGEGEFDDGSVYLTTDENGDYYQYHYSMHTWRELACLTFSVPDTLIFLDGISKATGDPLSLPTVYSAAEFLRIFKDEQAQEGVGFSTMNVYLVFDQNARPAVLQRFFVDWQ